VDGSRRRPSLLFLKIIIKAVFSTPKKPLPPHSGDVSETSFLVFAPASLSIIFSPLYVNCRTSPSQIPFSFRSSSVLPDLFSSEASHLLPFALPLFPWPVEIGCVLRPKFVFPPFLRLEVCWWRTSAFLGVDVGFFFIGLPPSENDSPFPYHSVRL